MSEFAVRLTERDADHLLAAIEWALNRGDLELGPGLRPAVLEEAARKIEAVADLARRGVYVAQTDARFEALLQHVHRTTHSKVPFADCEWCRELEVGLVAEFGLTDPSAGGS